MTGSHEDDFREVCGLLFGAKERYRTARAAISLTLDAVVAEEANRRFVDWRFEQKGGPGMGVGRKSGPPVKEDFYRGYESSEEVIRIWHERPDRWREDRSSAATGELLGAVAAAGRGASLWLYHPPSRPSTSPPSPSDATPTHSSPLCSTPRRIYFVTP